MCRETITIMQLLQSFTSSIYSRWATIYSHMHHTHMGICIYIITYIHIYVYALSAYIYIYICGSLILCSEYIYVNL